MSGPRTPWQFDMILHEGKRLAIVIDPVSGLHATRIVRAPGDVSRLLADAIAAIGTTKAPLRLDNGRNQWVAEMRHAASARGVRIVRSMATPYAAAEALRRITGGVQ